MLPHAATLLCAIFCFCEWPGGSGERNANKNIKSSYMDYMFISEFNIDRHMRQHERSCRKGMWRAHSIA